MIFKKILRKKNHYRLPTGYKENLAPKNYMHKGVRGSVSPYVYDMGLFVAKRAKVSNIIKIGCGNIYQIIPFLEAGYYVYCVDIGENIALIKKNLKKYKNIVFVECDLSKSFSMIEQEVINDAIIIAADVIEHIIDVDIFLKWISKVSYEAKYLFVSTLDRDKASGYGNIGKPANLMHVREWNANEFKLLLQDYSFNDNFLGHTINTNHHKAKANIIALSGKEIAYRKKQKQKKILAIINVYNEEDIVLETVEHLLTQGVDVYIYDDNSTDKTFELLQKKYQSDTRVIIKKRSELSQDYDWEFLLKHTEEIAQELEYDWFMHYDADEFRYSPWDSVSLQEAVTFIDSLGYNAIDFTVLDFRFLPDIKIESNFEENILAYEFGRREGHFTQIKLWKKQTQKVDLHSSGGHEAIFSNRKIYPVKFLTKHYPLRNMQQLQKKVFQDRASRIKKEQDEKGWHTQYDLLIGQREINELPWESACLRYWNKYITKDEYLVELISGIGIR